MTAGALDAHIVVARRGFVLDVALAVASGETIAIMGPSGAGKSTLLGAVAGLTRLTGGFLSIDGTEVAGRRPVPANRRGVVLLGQQARLFPHMSARANVAFGLRAQGADRDSAARDADEWLARVGLDGYGAQRPAELSGGQQQRVALARALATSPRVLLLDEPFTALDPETAGEIRAIVAEQLQRTGVTTLVVTHDAVDAASLAQRLVIIEDGRVTQEGPVREVLATPASRFAAAVAGVNRLVGHAGAGQWRSGDVVLSSGDPASRAAASAPGELAALVRPGDVRLDVVEDAASVDDPGFRTSPDIQDDSAHIVLNPRRAPESGAVGGGANTWTSRVVRLEQTPAGARVHTAGPPVAVDVAADAVAARGLLPGTPVRLHVAPRHVRFVRTPPPRENTW